VTKSVATQEAPWIPSRPPTHLAESASLSCSWLQQGRGGGNKNWRVRNVSSSALLLTHHTTWFGTCRHLQSRRGDRGWWGFCRYEASPLVTEHHCVHRSDCGSSWSADSRTSARRWQVSANTEFTGPRFAQPDACSTAWNHASRFQHAPTRAFACFPTQTCAHASTHASIQPSTHPPIFFHPH
jgi:hypothetical protein